MSAKGRAGSPAEERSATTIRRYLEALQLTRATRGRRRTAESVERELQQVRLQIVMGEPENRQKLARERVRLEAEFEALARTDGVDLSDLEDEFVACAATYSDRNGLSFAAWRSAGVDPGVLKRAGIFAAAR